MAGNRPWLLDKAAALVNYSKVSQRSQRDWIRVWTRAPSATQTPSPWTRTHFDFASERGCGTNSPTTLAVPCSTWNSRSPAREQDSGVSVLSEAVEDRGHRRLHLGRRHALGDALRYGQVLTHVRPLPLGFVSLVQRGGLQDTPQPP